MLLALDSINKTALVWFSEQPLTPSQAALVLSNTLSHTHRMPIQEHPMELHHSLHVISNTLN